MLSVHLKVCPEGQDVKKFQTNFSNWIQSQLDDNYDSYESFSVRLVTAESFDEDWKVQETYKDIPEIKEKYRNIANQGRLVYAEIDY